MGSFRVTGLIRIEGFASRAQETVLIRVQGHPYFRYTPDRCSCLWKNNLELISPARRRQRKLWSCSAEFATISGTAELFRCSSVR
jgi:hypothetical protein